MNEIRKPIKDVKEESNGEKLKNNHQSLEMNSSNKWTNKCAAKPS